MSHKPWSTLKQRDRLREFSKRLVSFVDGLQLDEWRDEADAWLDIADELRTFAGQASDRAEEAQEAIREERESRADAKGDYLRDLAKDRFIDLKEK